MPGWLVLVFGWLVVVFPYSSTTQLKALLGLRENERKETKIRKGKSIFIFFFCLFFSLYFSFFLESNIIEVKSNMCADFTALTRVFPD